MAIKNTFGLPSGISCPGATAVCKKICYAAKIETRYTNVRTVMHHNFDLLRNADVNTAVSLLDEMITEFVIDSTRRNAPLFFRIHFDGDFFSLDYARAWAEVIRRHPQVRFWAYTRSFGPALDVLPELEGLPNLALYLSVDVDNTAHAVATGRRHPWVRLASITQTMDEGKGFMVDLAGKPGAACPENLGRIPLISEKASACVSCALCIKGDVNIRFSIQKGSA